MKIAVITITQFKKFDSLMILKDILEEQTYRKYIYEWVIVDGSKTEQEGKLNEINIRELQKKTTLNIFYAKWKQNFPLGKLRNMSNSLVSPECDYIFCFDDDDYYFPQRIEYTIKMFNENPDKLISGCKSVFIYDHHLQTAFLTNEKDVFSSNNCLAYKKEYLKDHKYNDNAEMGEEASFLEDLKNENLLLQLDSKQIVYMNAHNVNTFNKREILFLAYFGLHQYISLNESLDMPEPYFERYKKLYQISNKSKYDIVYICGFLGVQWAPNDETLGGSEQAVVQLCTYFKKYGKNVAVYGNIKSPCVYNDVEYYPMNMFNFNDEYNNVIIWRDLGAMILRFNIKTKNIILDQHDNIKISPFQNIHKSVLNKINVLAFKSNYHLKSYLECLNVPKEGQDEILKHSVIIPNGVHNEFFDFVDDTKKIKNRFCYCSCYTRGLAEILLYVFPEILKYDPTAELHIYYGMDLLNEEYKKKLIEIIGNSQNVMNHGRQDRKTIIEEKKKSQFQLYTTNTELEIDCISIKEAQKLNCIPLITNYGVFAERNGLHIDEDLNSVESYKNVGRKIVEIMKSNKIEEITKQMIINDNLISWETTAKIWLNNIIK